MTFRIVTAESEGVGVTHAGAMDVKNQPLRGWFLNAWLGLYHKMPRKPHAYWISGVLHDSVTAEVTLWHAYSYRRTRRFATSSLVIGASG